MKTTYRNNFLTETYALQKHSFFLIGVMHCKLNALPVMIIIFFQSRFSVVLFTAMPQTSIDTAQ